jgi:iron complex transport system substrate-binding protein
MRVYAEDGSALSAMRRSGFGPARRRSARSLLLSLAMALAMQAAAAMPGAPRVTDDTGATVTLAAPARRVVSLGPHLAELAVAAGGGEALVGVIRFSDFPPTVRTLPIVGDAHMVDFERILQLKPDLVLVWGSGMNERHKARLRSLGLTVYESEIRQAQGIPDTLRRLGTLFGREATAETAARRFEHDWRALAERWRGRAPVRVFWQLWHEPLMTINHQHLISEAMRTCGGVNVFAELPLLTPAVSWEAALATAPQLVAASGRPEDAEGDFAAWRRIAGASTSPRFAIIDGDLIGRMGPRFVQGATALCEAIDAVR